MDKHETATLFANALGEAQQTVVDKIHDAVETAERRGFALGEAQAFRALLEGRESDIETLLWHYINRDYPPLDNVERPIDRAVNNLRRHLAAARASQVEGAPPEGAFLENEREERSGTYIVHVRIEVYANSGVDARIQVSDLLETGTHEGGAENAITAYKLTSPPVYLDR